MTEYKGLGSNAHTWARLKCPDMLRTYLKIAERMGLNMPHPGKSTLSYEYDPKKSTVLWEPRVFRRPWNHPDNIATARDMIIKELFDRDGLLARYIDPDDLKPIHVAPTVQSNLADWKSWMGSSPNPPTRISPGGPYDEYKSTVSSWTPPKSNFTQPIVRDSDFQMYDNWFNRSLEQKLSKRIDRLEPLPPARPPGRGILKGGNAHVNNHSSDFDDDVEVKYKSSWHESAYVTNSIAGRKLRGQMKNSLSYHAATDDVFNESDFDESDFVDLS